MLFPKFYGYPTASYLWTQPGGLDAGMGTKFFPNCWVMNIPGLSTPLPDPLKISHTVSNMGYQTRQRYECKFPVDSTERLARKHGIVGLFQMIGLPDGEISSLGFRHSHDVPWGIIDVSLSCYDWDGMSVWNGTGQ